MISLYEFETWNIFVYTVILSRMSILLNMFLHRWEDFSILICGCEKWSLTLRDKRRLRVFENRVLMWIFGFQRNDNGEWRRLYNQKLHILYRSPNTVRVIERWQVHLQEIDLYEGLGVDGRTMDLEGIGINTRNWVDSAQDRDYWKVLVNAKFNLRAP